MFRGVSNVITFIDDMMTHKKDHYHQMEALQQCFDQMGPFNMKFNIKKSVFGATKATYLGFKISGEGISPTKDKVEAVHKLTSPISMTEVGEFIEFCNYFRRMIPKFSQLVSPLINITNVTYYY